MKAQLMESILVIVLALGALAWSAFGMVRSGGWFLNKQKWALKPLDKFWSFLMKPAFLGEGASGKPSWKQAAFAFAITCLLFLASVAIVVLMAAGLLR